jgi:hypothetical protein
MVDHQRTRLALVAVDGFAAISAISGGAMVVTGWPYQFPSTWLEGTPFPDYTAPGLILGFVVGGSALLATVAMLRNPKVGGFVSVVAGAIMMGWIVGEMLILRTGGFTWLWPLYFAVGLAMALLGGRLVGCGLGLVKRWVVSFGLSRVLRSRSRMPP